MSDGVGFEASADNSLLLRTEGTKRILIPVHVRRILQGKAEDIALQNDDILYIPTNSGKAALKGGAAGLIVSLASTYIYAHP
jgi:polysaccharide export outer membrane protein